MWVLNTRFLSSIYQILHIKHVPEILCSRLKEGIGISKRLVKELRNGWIIFVFPLSTIEDFINVRGIVPLESVPWTLALEMELVVLILVPLLRFKTVFGFIFELVSETQFIVILVSMDFLCVSRGKEPSLHFDDDMRTFFEEVSDFWDAFCLQ